MTPAASYVGPPPSRVDNPFATCWTQPGALPYLASEEVSVDQVVQSWRNAGRRGQVVGPHGVGKSTLLVAVGDCLAVNGHRVHSVVFRANQKRPPLRSVLAAHDCQPGDVLLIDGLEQLNLWQRGRLLRLCRTAKLGVLASTHHATRGLPTLARLAPSAPLMLRLYRELTRSRPTPVTEAMASEAFVHSQGDVRETLFRLYDLHESLIRNATAARR